MFTDAWIALAVVFGLLGVLFRQDALVVMSTILLMVIAVACVTLVQRHRVVSPWFPMLLLIYPVSDALSSARRLPCRSK